MFNNLIRKFYADNVELNLGSGGKTIATDEIASVQHELVKVEFGVDGSATMVSAANPLPVTDNAAEVSLASIDTKTPSLGQAAMAASTPVAIASNQSAIPVSGTFFQATQPVSAASLPLPSGAATAALQTQPGVDIGDVTVNNAAGVAAVNIQDGGNSITVDGTFFQATQPISAAALPLPTGASTLAEQQSQTTLLTNIDAGIPAALGQATMANSMPVVIASNQSAIPVSGTISVGAVDNTQLYSNTLSVTGAISGIDTTGYQSIVFGFSGVWSGNLLVEGSADNSVWEQLTLIDVNEIAMQDVVNENGVFQIKSTSKYVRINVQQVTGTITALIVGRTVTGINAADAIAFAMDKSFNMPLYVEETGSKKDVSKALIPSDAPAPIYGWAQATSSVIFQVDTTGYQSVVVQAITLGSNITVQHSNDGVTWASLNGYGIGSSVSTTTLSATGIWQYPAVGKFVRGIMAGANFANVLVFLRQQPPSSAISTAGSPMNIQAVGGTTVVNGGVAGILSVGGNIANGVAPTANPILIAGIDNTATAGLTRRILVDTSGRTIIAGTDQTATTRAIGVVPAAASNLNVASLTIQDTSIFEGQSQIELLAQILLELRINNQMMAELPLVLQGQNGKFDEPAQFRQDQSLFAI